MSSTHTKIPSSRPPTAKTNLRKKPSGCLILCNEFVHDFACPSVTRVYSLHEIEQNFNILRTTLGSICDPGQYRRPPGTPYGASTPDTTQEEIELDFRLLHEAITRSCGNKTRRGFDQTPADEEAAAALILMGMDGEAGEAYKPTQTDVLYHELSCRSDLTPGASKEEIQEDMKLFREAITGQQDANYLLSISGASPGCGEDAMRRLDAYIGEK